MIALRVFEGALKRIIPSAPTGRVRAAARVPMNF